MAARDPKLNPLAAVLNQALKNLDLQEAALEARVVMLWPKVVGAQLAKATEAQRMQGGTLLVVTRNSAWNQELSFQKLRIVQRYREHLGQDFVKDVRFNVGLVRGLADTTISHAPPEEEVRRIRLPVDEIARIRVASEEADPELAQAIRRALTREAQIRHWHLDHGARPCNRCGAAHRSPHDRCPACRLEGTRKPGDGKWSNE